MKMNKGLKLLGIAVIVLACTPKKSGAELAMEAKIAEMEKQLAALSGTGNEAKAAELQAELQTAQAGLEAARGSQNNPAQAAAQTAAGGTAAETTTAQTPTANQPQIAAVQAEAERRAEAGEPQLTNSEKEALLFAPPAQPPAQAVTTTGNFQMDGTTLTKYNGNEANVTIPSSVTTIGFSVFQGNTNLTSVTIPSSVTEIKNSVFNRCTNLTSVTIPNSIFHIWDGAFRGSGLTSVTFSPTSSLMEIRADVFRDCINLKSITIPSSVTAIGRSAFEGCTSLTNVTIPSSVNSIEANAFYNCTSLTSVTIPSSVKQNAFANCNNLRSVTFGRAMTRERGIEPIIDAGLDENLSNAYFSGRTGTPGTYVKQADGSWVRQ